jgi:hypothetical protein
LINPNGLKFKDFHFVTSHIIVQKRTAQYEWHLTGRKFAMHLDQARLMSSIAHLTTLDKQLMSDVFY